VPGGRQSGAFRRPDGTDGQTIASLVLVAPDGLTVDGCLAPARAQRDEVKGRLAGVVEDFGDGPEMARVARLRSQLAEAGEKAKAAEAAPGRAKAAAREAILDGNDPSVHEQAYRRALVDKDVMANRVQAVEQALAQATAAARKELAFRLACVRETLLGEARRALAEVEQQVAAVAGPQLLELLRLRELVDGLKLAAPHPGRWSGGGLIEQLVEAALAGE
jgi:hypothetical protein